MKHHHHVPSGHKAATTTLAGAALISFASHWVDHTTEAVMFCINGLIAAYAADIERLWNEHFHGTDQPE